MELNAKLAQDFMHAPCDNGDNRRAQYLQIFQDMIKMDEVQTLIGMRAFNGGSDVTVIWDEPSYKLVTPLETEGFEVKDLGNDHFIISWKNAKPHDFNYDFEAPEK